MNPKRFLLIAGTVLITIGTLGVMGLFGKISSVSFFHPPYWINWVHLVLGVFVLIVSSKGSNKLQVTVILFPTFIATFLGVTGLLFGKYAADRLNIPELADPSDHIAHLTVGLLALWAWHNRKVK